MSRIVTLLIALSGIACLSQLAFADELLPADAPIQAVIDHYISAKLTAANVTPTSRLDDDAFLRRLSLDLAGRVPTVKELEDFRSWSAEERRTQAVDHLMSQADFAFHQANEIDLLLLAKIRKDNEWRDFLLQAAKENRSWDVVFKQVMTPELECPGEVGPAAFLRERVRELDDITNDTAVLFFGVNISCAKCHDHPLVADWEQQHYYGMQSFFKRTYQTKARLLGEDLQGDVKFTNVLGEEKQAQFMFLSNVSVEEPELVLEDDKRKQFEEAVKQAKNDDKATAPDVAFRPRAELIKLALEKDEKNFFARNIVNRIWARLIGRGLVMPLDQMHSDNPPSHPELMDWLSRDLQENGYDLKRLIRGIVQSEVYARSSRWTTSGEPPSPDLFARGVVRPLTPRQLALSLQVATFNSQQLPGFEKPDDWEKKRQDLENRASGFADLFPIPDEGFQVGTDEALLFSNSQRFEGEFIRSSGDRLVGELKNLSDAGQQIDLMFRSVLTRTPTAIEQQSIQQYLESRSDRTEDALKQVAWVLLSSPEFRFNH